MTHHRIECFETCAGLLAGVVLILLSPIGVTIAARGPQDTLSSDSIAARLDPYADKQRVVVMTDIANEPDDQMSLVRFLVYANQFDIDGLMATTSTWLRNKVRPDVIRLVVDAYAAVQPRLNQHQPGFPTAESVKAAIASGQPGFGMAAVGPDRMTAGSELILRVVQKPDPRPVWVLAWGGTNTLAQALLHARATKPAEVLWRAKGLLDAGRRCVPRAGQLSGYGCRRRRQNLYLGSGDDLAMADGLPARFRRAHGLDDRGRERREPQSRGRGERHAGQSAGGDRCRGRRAGDARCEGDARSGRPRADVVAGTAHIILAVEDNGSPALTSYRRIILTINPR